MGEIGIEHHTALHDLRFWQIQQAIDGYNRRHRDDWSMTRWQTYNLIAAQCGGENLSKSGIHSPVDLIRFPWEKLDTPPETSQADIDELQELMSRINNGVTDGDFTRGGKGTG